MKKLNDIIWIRNSASAIANNKEQLPNVQMLLDDKGPGFCLAKFTQVTLHLGTGLVHSCHHPTAHKIPTSELENNPNALFNTTHLKQVRKEMFEGKKPAECDYCWRVESSNGISDRLFKSIEPWAINEHDKIIDAGPDADFYPTYLEVDFSNVCNFQCIYCGPEYSSVWVDDLKKNGPLKVLDNTKYVQWVQGYQNLDSLNYKNSEFNPYIDAFWKWFPKAYSHLKTYRITGGEPLLSKETFKSMDWFIENPNLNLEFSINTNMGVPDKIWNQFIEKLRILSNGSYVNKVTVFTSVDTWGEQAEYLRPGLNFELFKRRYEEILSLGTVRCTIMCTFNILSIPRIKSLLEWHLTLKKTYNQDPWMKKWETEFNCNLGGDFPFKKRNSSNAEFNSIVGIDIPYLRHPQALDPKYAQKDIIEKYLVPAINFMANNLSNPSWGLHQGFEPYEVEKLKRIVIDILSYINSPNEEEVSINRAKFYDFVNEIDKRHKKNFLEVFPEMVEFYQKSKEERTKIYQKENNS